MNDQNSEQWLQLPEEQQNKSNYSITTYFSHIPRAQFAVGVMGGASQIIFGTAIIVVCMLQYIEALWLSVTLLTAAIISVVIGLAIMLITLLKNSERNTLIQKAINHVVKFKN